MWRDIENLFSGQFSNPWLPQAYRNLNCRMKKWYIVQIPWQYAENITFTYLNYSVTWRRTFFHRNRFLFTPQLELNQFTSAENLTLCFQIIHLPVAHSAWQTTKGIFKSHFVFKTQSLKICAQYWQTSSVSGPMIHLTSLAVRIGKNIHTNIYANNIQDYWATA